MDIGVFIPIGNNGWLISEAAPQYKPSFALNKAIVQKAEGYGLDFALSMIKLHGFGGKTEFWDYNLESFTLMAGLAAVTERIRLFASTAVLTLPPALVARMATTIESIAPGRFGVNIVSGWQKAEYAHGPVARRRLFRLPLRLLHRIRPGDEGAVGDRTFRLQGEHFTDGGLHDEARAVGPIPIVAAGQSGRGMEFAPATPTTTSCWAPASTPRRPARRPAPG